MAKSFLLACIFSLLIAVRPAITEPDVTQQIKVLTDQVSSLQKMVGELEARRTLIVFYRQICHGDVRTCAQQYCQSLNRPFVHYDDIYWGDKNANYLAALNQPRPADSVIWMLNLVCGTP
jgi:hypothetical protein